MAIGGTAPAAAPAADPAAQVAATSVQGSNAVNMENPAPVTDAGPQMPEGGSEKFWDADKGVYNWEGDAKEKAWQLGQKGEKPAEKPAATEEAPPEGDAPTDQQAEDVAEAVGLDMEAVNTAIAETGTITEEQRKLITSIGLPDEVIDTFIEQRIFQAKMHIAEVTEFAGGERGLAALKEWATKNLPDSERFEYSQALGNPDKWRVAAADLLQRAGMTAGKQAPLLQGDNAALPGTTGAAQYASDAEFQRDLRLPQYKTDPVFRGEVEARLRNSPHIVNQNARAHGGGL